MQQHTTPVPNFWNEGRTWFLVSSLLLGFVVLALPARAQAPEASEPVEPSDALTVSEEDSKAAVDPVGGSWRGRGKHKERANGASVGSGGQGRRGQMHGSGRPEAQAIHFLVANHSQIERTVEIIPGGVRTLTVAEDLEIIDTLRIHVHQMADLIHEGGRIRNWDPLFAEIFDHRQAIQMKITDIQGGVEVVETSTDEDVALLIQAHAEKVEEFVARGIEAYREETPLPEAYTDTSP